MARLPALMRMGALTVLLFLCRVAGADRVLPSTGIDPVGELFRLSASCGLALPSVSLPFSRSFTSRTLEALAVDECPRAQAYHFIHRSLAGQRPEPCFVFYHRPLLLKAPGLIER